jgi:TolA-binding protein
MVFGFMSSETPQKEVKQVKSAQRLEPQLEPARETDVYDLLAWLEVNKRKVAGVALAAVVAGFIIYTWSYMKGQKDLKASTALLDLRPSMATSTNNPPVPASSFDKVAAEYPGTSAAERAELLAATALFTEGKYPDAQTRFSKFVNDHPQSPWGSEAQYGVAAALEAQSKTNEALNAYQQVITAYGTSSVAGDAKLAQARIYEEQQKPEQALRLYNELLPTGSAAGRMPARSEAFSKREALYKQFPYLNTNKPLSTVTGPSTLTPPVKTTNNAPSPAGTVVINPATNAAAPQPAAPANPPPQTQNPPKQP